MKVNLFVLMPESNPQFQWITNLEEFIEHEKINDYILNLFRSKESIKLENYNGYYDGLSLLDLTNQIKILEDSYPKPILRTLRSLFKDFFNWREEPTIINEYSYFILNQNILKHSLCEISQRKKDNELENFAIINHQIISINEISVLINQNVNISIDLINNNVDLINWFSENRIPKRNFQSIPKHKIQNPIIKNNKLISPLYGTEENANIILNSAIGISLKELFGFDKLFNKVIVYKFENNTPQNQYHGYHVDTNSDEIPNEIRIRLDL